MTDPSVDPHLDLDGLADHLAGETDASQHLSACAGCAARLAELEAAGRMVVAALRPLSDPPLPAAAADRIDAPLRAEPPTVAPAVGPPTSVPPAATVTPLAVARTARRRAWLPSVAAAAVLVAGGLLGYGLLQGGTSDQSAGTTSAAAPPAADSRGAAYPTVASGLDYADPAAIEGALAGVLDGSAGFTSAQTAPNPAAGQVAASLAPEALATPDPLARLREPAALADCLATLLDPARPNDQPLALDYASYRGAPALAVVLADADPAKVAVFVVGPNCSRADDNLAFFARLNRP
ncbi:MAG: hypothetical protein H7323_11555 [Frankiales bacterium]|nr:hypothetical protein [Frankiales bacterium]